MSILFYEPHLDALRCQSIVRASRAPGVQVLTLTLTLALLICTAVIPGGLHRGGLPPALAPRKPVFSRMHYMYFEYTILL